MANKLECHIEVLLLKNKLLLDAKTIKKNMEDMEYPIMTTEAEIKAACYYKRKYSAIDTNKAKMKLNLWISNKCTAKSKRNMIEIRLKILSREYDHIMGAINKLDEILN